MRKVVINFLGDGILKKNILIRLSMLCTVSFLLITSSLLAEVKEIPAFPGAEGFGAYAKGGRGGKVLHVTNLNDDGPGSLRWAVEQKGRRTVVFDISGIIEIKSKLDIENPYITIAGQTAPGDGICIKGETLDVATHDVIIRYIRCRLGDSMHGVGGLQGKDAISVSKGWDIIIDHCSASWSLDEALSASTHYPNMTRITVQWCFITEGLNPDNHGFGSLIRGSGGAKFSYLYNLYAHNRGRNPRPGNYDDNPYFKDSDGFLLDFRNNVIYNWGGDYAGYSNDAISITRLNYVGNYLIPGINSANNGIAYSTGSPYNRSYFAENYYDGQLVEDQWSLLRWRESWSDNDICNYKKDQPFETGPVKHLEAPEAYKRVLQSGGAILPKRDAVDIRIVTSVKNRTGKIITSQNDVGGWPELVSASAPIDTDQDGMPDSWEKEMGFDPHDASDGKMDKDGDGYTNLEEYLNNTDPAIFIDYINLTERAGLQLEEFVFGDSRPFRSCHSSSILELENGELLCVYFAGSGEGNPDVEIWMSRKAPGGAWSAPVSVADGDEGGERMATGNPVLFQPQGGDLLLFYKVFIPETEFMGRVKTSSDGGHTWSKPQKVGNDFIGAVKNKPIQLADGTILSPSSIEDENGWRVHVERSTDNGKSWTFIGPILPKDGFGAIQPTLLTYPDGRIQLLCRTSSKHGFIGESWSEDKGLTWTPLDTLGMPNNNSGLDGVTLKDGRQLLVYNHSTRTQPGMGRKGRGILNVATSRDGINWEAAMILDYLDDYGKQFSYPSVIQSRDGLVHIVYTWHRERIKHVVLDPESLVTIPMPDGKWPSEGPVSLKVFKTLQPAYK